MGGLGAVDSGAGCRRRGRELDFRRDTPMRVPCRDGEGRCRGQRCTMVRPCRLAVRARHVRRRSGGRTRRCCVNKAIVVFFVCLTVAVATISLSTNFNRIVEIVREVGASMPIEVLMPALSPTMEKGNLAKWVKKEGEKVKAGDVIAEIETDKATMEVEAVDEGTLGQILVPEGTADVAVNTPIAMILAEGEDAGALKTAASAAPAPAQSANAAEPSASAAQQSAAPMPSGAKAACQGGRRQPKSRSRAAAAAEARARAGRAGRHRDGHHDGARSVARRHGRRDAPRRRRCS